MIRRSRRIAGWLLVGVLLWPWWPTSLPHKTSLASKLLGPVAPLAAHAEWIRFDWYVREGQFEEAYTSAERALALAPEATRGWMTLARHLIFFRASLENEPDGEQRRRWIESGLELLQRGRDRAVEPEELAYMQGLVYAYIADLESLGADLEWPGGADRARELAAGAFHDSGRMGKLDGFLMEGAIRTGPAELPPGWDH